MVLDASRLNLRQQELRVAADRGEQVVEILCDAAREAAHAFETLCTPQVALELLLARDIGEVAVDVELTVVTAIDKADVPHPDLATLPCRDPVFDGLLPMALAQLVEGGEETRKILRCHSALPEVRCSEVFRREAEYGLDLRADEHGLRRRFEPHHVGDEREMLDECAVCFYGRRHASLRNGQGL